MSEQVLIIHLGGCDDNDDTPATYSITALDKSEPVHMARNLGAEMGDCELLADPAAISQLAILLTMVATELNDAAGQEIARQYGEENRQ